MSKCTLSAAAVLLALGLSSAPLWAAPAPSDLPVPPIPAGNPALANPIDTPITGAAESPGIPEIERPPSLEALMAVRPGYGPGTEKSSGRDDIVRQAAWAFGAQGGLAARSDAINEMLRRYAATLDQVFDFRTLVLPVGGGQTLLRPPVITQAQMALALDPSGQTASESHEINAIARKAALVSRPPEWRTWLVRPVTPAQAPPDAQRPATRHEVVIWREAMARGWAAGERQAVDIFLDDLARLERDIIGMARYRVLLRAGRVKAPDLALMHRPSDVRDDTLRIDSTDMRIDTQAHFEGNRAHWHGVEEAP